MLASAVFLALFTPAAGQQQSPAAHFVQLYVYPALFGSMTSSVAGGGSGGADDFGLAEWWSQLFDDAADSSTNTTTSSMLTPLTIPVQQAAEVIMFVSMMAAVLDMGLWRRLVPAAWRSGPVSPAAHNAANTVDKKRQ